MKKLLYLLLFLPALGIAKNGITFQVEKLEKPEKLLQELTVNQILENLILQDANIPVYGKDKVPYPLGILAQSHVGVDLVNYGYHPFFNGMYSAYADHRPFVLSPDMIWLLISQGFAHHVNNNSEKLRHHFVDFDGKTTLIVLANKYAQNGNWINDKETWEKIFPDFTEQIQEHVGKELLDNLTCNFSTTTPAAKAAAEITIMEAMKTYFEYVVMMIGCGIPEITLEGTPDDWQKVLDKAKSLRKYELDWWIDELEPLLKEFVNASKGKVSKPFWMNMFRQHTTKGYGNPKIFDGWIVKFFPYDKEGKRTSLKEIRKWDALPPELVKVDVKYQLLDDAGNVVKETPLELWAGFIGLRQNSSNYALKPEIGWLIREKNEEVKSKVLSDKLKKQSYIDIRVNVVPKEILALLSIENLSIRFTGKIVIPYEMKNIRIGTLRLNGAISPEETERIVAMFPSTYLYINGTGYNKAVKNNRNIDDGITQTLKGRVPGIITYRE